MRSFTDIFIKHPVLAVVVNLVIVLVGWRALTTLPVQQYPKIESSSVVITTVYYGASAETVRGFLTTPIERVGLGDRRRRLRRVDQPRRRQHRHGAPQAEPQQHGGAGRGHRAAAAGALGAAGGGRAAGGRGAARRPAVRVVLPELHVHRARACRPITDWLVAHAAAAARDAAGRAARDHRGRPPDRHARLDRSGSAGRAQPLARRRARGAAAQQLPRRRRPDQGQPGAGQPARQHRPALGRGVREPDRRRPRRRHRAPERRGAGRARAPKRPTWSPSTTTRRASTSACGRWSASNEIEVAHRLRDGDGAHPADAAEGHRHAPGLGRHDVHARTR